MASAMSSNYSKYVPEVLADLQNCEFEMIKQFNKICEENNIHGTLFLKCVAWFGVVISVVFMVLQVIPIPGLSGVHFCIESYILLVVWIMLGMLFMHYRKDFFAH